MLILVGGIASWDLLEARALAKSFSEWKGVCGMEKSLHNSQRGLDERLDLDVSGMSRRSFCCLLAAVGVSFVACGPDGVLKAYAADGEEVADLVNPRVDAQSINEGLQASASEGDILLASFFVNTRSDGKAWYDILCTSTDGMLFEQIGVPYNESQNPFHDPSIVYKDGYFWMFGAWQKYDQKFWPMIGYSPDLVNWSAPEGGQLINNGTWGGIPYDVVPFGLDEVTNVAPDAFVDDDGTVYLIVCAGHYEGYYNEPEAGADGRMLPYLVKITELSCDGFAPWSNDAGQHFPNNLRVTASPARLLNLPIKSSYRIDGSLYKENGVYYLPIKRDGINNEIYSNNDIDDVNGWKLVKDGLVIGNEGPSLVRFNGQWLLYTDKIASWPSLGGVGATGIRVSKASDMRGDWTDQELVATIDINRDTVHSRHGTVIRVTDPNAKNIVWKARAAAGWKDNSTIWFSDVLKSDWAYEAIYYCADKGLISGYSGTRMFGTYDPLTRAQAITVLWRFFEPDEAAAYASTMAHTRNTTGLADVDDYAWYTGAANWAVRNNVMSGYAGSSNLAPHAPMTREQLFAVVANAAHWLCGAVIEGADTAKFDAMPDSGTVSEWARGSVAWGLNNDVMAGWLDPATSIRYIMPQANIDRSTMAGVMMNALKKGVLFNK